MGLCLSVLFLFHFPPREGKRDRNRFSSRNGRGGEGRGEGGGLGGGGAWSGSCYMTAGVSLVEGAGGGGRNLI